MLGKKTTYIEIFFIKDLKSNMQKALLSSHYEPKIY